MTVEYPEAEAGTDALDGLRSLALRSESADAVDELVGEVRRVLQRPPEGLPQPPPLLVLVATITAEGRSQLDYTCTPEQAASALRQLADTVDLV